MKIALVTLLLAACAFAQTEPVAPAEACGPANVAFKVKLDESQHLVALPQPGKALVYFFSDAGTTATLGYPTEKLAIDGAWAGANHGNSHFSVPIEPGEHHVCVTLQSSFVAPRVELAHFTAEPGKVYYYRVRLVTSRSMEMLELDPIDSDQGKYLVETLPLAVSSRKK
jgi:hypothetical protein